MWSGDLPRAPLQGANCLSSSPALAPQLPSLAFAPIFLSIPVAPSGLLKVNLWSPKDEGEKTQTFPGSSAGKEPACNAGDPGSIPESGRSAEEGIDYPLLFLGFPSSSAGKESTCNTGDLDSSPGLGRSPGEGTGDPLKYSGLENSMDRIVHGGHKESDTTEQLSLSLSKMGRGFLGGASGKEPTCQSRRHKRQV